MIQNHLTSQPLSKRLEELGVPQVSEYYWHDFSKSGGDLYLYTHSNNSPSSDVYSAFLSSELGELLPKRIESAGMQSLSIRKIQPYKEGAISWWVSYGSVRPFAISKSGETMAESMGLILEYLILNGLIKL